MLERNSIVSLDIDDEELLDNTEDYTLMENGNEY